MIIKSVEFKNHHALGNTIIKLKPEVNNLSINLLAGENGVGKTILLDEITKFMNGNIQDFGENGLYKKFTLILNDDEKQLINYTGDELIFESNETHKQCEIKNSEGERVTLVTRNIGEPYIQLFKYAYSTVEINFTSEEISTISATSIDDDRSKKSKSSQNISKEISQLLVDISTQDASDIGKWHNDNLGSTLKLTPFDGKLKRFKNSYNKMFTEKEFLGIEVVDGKHKVQFKNLHNDSTFGINKLSSGEKQIVYRIGYLLKNLKVLNSGIILIDEPELSLHPKWQIKFLSFIKDIFNGVSLQFIIVTHSPFILQSASSEEASIVILKRDGNNVKSETVDIDWTVFEYFGPTIAEVNYKAFGIISTAFHSDLYNQLMEKWMGGSSSCIAFETEIKNRKPTIRIINWGVNKSETLITCIRHKVHHFNNTDRPDFSQVELKESIELMISFIAE
jgi:predicted ATPase